MGGQAALVTASSRFPFSVWFSFLIRDQVTMTTLHSGSPFIFVLYIILKINLLSVWHLLPFLTNFFSFILAQYLLKETHYFRGFAATDVTVISSRVDSAFSGAWFPTEDSPCTHFTLNWSSIIQLLKPSRAVMVHWGLFWFKIHPHSPSPCHPKWHPLLFSASPKLSITGLVS